MKTPIFTGSGLAMITPMNADGSVNYEKYRELVEWQIENGTDAIIACGTTGESSTLTDEEHIGVIQAAIEQTAGRVPVISGTGSNDTAYCIELSKEAEKLGADALLLVTPYYNKTSQRGLATIINSVFCDLCTFNQTQFKCLFSPLSASNYRILNQRQIDVYKRQESPSTQQIPLQCDRSHKNWRSRTSRLTRVLSI